MSGYLLVGSADVDVLVADVMYATGIILPDLTSLYGFQARDAGEGTMGIAWVAAAGLLVQAAMDPTRPAAVAARPLDDRLFISRTADREVLLGTSSVDYDAVPLTVYRIPAAASAPAGGGGSGGTGYCTAADVEAVIGRPALLAAAPDPDPDHAGTVDTAAVERAISAVGSRIDGWLRIRYNLPLADVPEVLRRAAVRLVHAELVSEDTTTDLIESRAKEATRLLERMADGRIRIGGDLDGDGDANATSGHARAHVAPRTVTYGRAGLRGLV